MTLRDILNLMDHEVWVRVMLCGRDKPDIVLWSADWIGGSGYPDEIEEYLEYDADDMSTELHQNPERRRIALEPMIVVCVYCPEYFKEVSEHE